MKPLLSEIHTCIELCLLLRNSNYAEMDGHQQQPLSPGIYSKQSTHLHHAPRTDRLLYSFI